MNEEDKQIVGEQAMEAAAIVPPRPGEEEGANGKVPEAETRPEGSVGD